TSDDASPRSGRRSAVVRNRRSLPGGRPGEAISERPGGARQTARPRAVSRSAAFDPAGTDPAGVVAGLSVSDGRPSDQRRGQYDSRKPDSDGSGKRRVFGEPAGRRHQSRTGRSTSRIGNAGQGQGPASPGGRTVGETGGRT